MNYLNRLMGHGELVVHLARRHFSVLVPAILLVVLLCALIGAADYAAYLYLNLGDVALAGLALAVVPLLWLAWRILVWQNEVYVVTNRRVIRLRGVINKDVVDSSLEKVNDILMRQSLLGRLFNYGDIEILTASDIGANRFPRIAAPVQFKSALLNAKQELEHPAPALAAAAPQLPGDDPASLLMSLKTLYDQGILTEDEYQAKKADILARF